MARTDEIAEPSFAARLEARRFGTAMAEIIPIIATTRSNSINEKPSCRWLVFMTYLVLRAERNVLRFLASPHLVIKTVDPIRREMSASSNTMIVPRVRFSKTVELLTFWLSSSWSGVEVHRPDKFRQRRDDGFRQ